MFLVLARCSDGSKTTKSIFGPQPAVVWNTELLRVFQKSRRAHLEVPRSLKHPGMFYHLIFSVLCRVISQACAQMPTPNLTLG